MENNDKKSHSPTILYRPEVYFTLRPNDLHICTYIYVYISISFSQKNRFRAQAHFS